MPILTRRSSKPPKKLSKRDISRNRLEHFKKEVDTDLHTISIEQLCKRLDTNTTRGLTKEQAKHLLETTGPNTLTPSTIEPEYVKFAKNLFHGFSLLLWVGAFLCFVAVFIQYMSTQEIDYDNLVLGMVLIAVVVITGCFMFYQEHKSSKIMESFANMIPLRATVIRDGESVIIDTWEIVMGDLIDVKSGDRIPADIRIIRCQGLRVIQVDNSTITGESDPLLRTTESTNPNILETKNVAFFSTNAIEGVARGLVIGCGDQTIMGRIAGLTARIKPNKTPISCELEYFMKIISCWATFLGVVFGFLAIAMNYTWIESTLFVIGIIVANVPEGLLATVTVCLTVTAKRMASKNCLVKNLEAVETLGSTSTICSDKTGTLTQNRMTVCHIWYNFKTVVAGSRENQKYRNEEGFDLLIRCATLCNRAEFVPTTAKLPINQREVRGDASEAAILKFCEMTLLHGPLDQYKSRNPKLVEIPFNSSTKYQISVHGTEEGPCLIVMKGAPERVLERCETIFLDNEDTELTDELRANCDLECLDLAGRGERVLGFADLVLEDRYSRRYPFATDPTPNFPQKKLRFLGFMALIDPPRPQVKEAVETCRLAGIKVIMVTGDHPLTAKSIAQAVGIITAKNTVEAANVTEHTPLLGEHRAIVVHGSSLREMLPEELDELIFSYREIVFARTSPTQKLQIVESCQRLGEIVAVTGDGVNDSPALKKADVGISMGITGSEVSQQSADMILLDDNFASIVIGIEEGRRIFDNLKKSITYVLCSNIPEIMPVLAFVILRIPLPIGIIAILCIDLLTDMMPAISLAYEKAESDIMDRPPRNPRVDKLVTPKLYYFAYGHTGIIETAALFFVYFMVMAEHGFMPDRLIGVREDWDSRDINDLRDSYGQAWTYSERKVLEYTCYSADMISVVVTQWAHAIVCKTRYNSIFTQGMQNWMLNLSLVIETCVAIFLTYFPYAHYLKLYPVKVRWWLYSAPFAIIMILFDEFRKWNIRHYPKGYFKLDTYY